MIFLRSDSGDTRFQRLTTTGIQDASLLPSEQKWLFICSAISSFCTKSLPSSMSLFTFFIFIYLRDTHQPVRSSGRKSRLPLHSYLIKCSQCAETIEMSDICAILLTPALGKGHFSHNFPFPQNRPPVFYLHCRD